VSKYKGLIFILQTSIKMLIFSNTLSSFKDIGGSDDST